MERTELREQFFAEVHTDPYAAMVFKLWTQAWALGYNQALSDADVRREKSHSDLCADAAEWLTAERQKAEAKAMIALADIGRKLSPANPLKF